MELCRKSVVRSTGDASTCTKGKEKKKKLGERGEKGGGKKKRASSQLGGWDGELSGADVWSAER
jgi:hypothetical protein